MGRHIARIICLLLLPCLLAACSATRYAYNQAPVLLNWWVADWFDFDRDQAAKVKDSLVQLHDWHRAQMLPVWAQQLQQLTDEMANTTTPERICAWGDQIQQQIDLLAQQAISLSAPIATGMGPRQWKQLDKRIQERNEEWRKEWMPATNQEQLEHRYDKTSEQAEKWYGSLEKSQRQLIRSSLEQSNWSAQKQLDQVIKRQKDLQATLRSVQGRSPAEAHTMLQDLWKRSQQPTNEADRAYHEQLRLEVCQTIARFHNSTTAEQRKYAQKRLQGYVDDMQALVLQR